MTRHFLPKASEQLCTSHSEQSVTVHTRTLDRPCSCPCSLPRTHTHPTWMVNLSPVLDSGQGPGICLGLWDNSWQASSRANKGQTNTPSSTLLLLLLPAEGPAQARPPVFTEARATEPLAKPSLQQPPVDKPKQALCRCVTNCLPVMGTCQAILPSLHA